MLVLSCCSFGDVVFDLLELINFNLGHCFINYISSLKYVSLIDLLSHFCLLGGSVI